MQGGKTQVSHKVSQCKALQCKVLECKTPRLIPRYLLCQNALRLLLRHLPNAFSTRPRPSLHDNDDVEDGDVDDDGEVGDDDEDHSDVDDDDR